MGFLSDVSDALGGGQGIGAIGGAVVQGMYADKANQASQKGGKKARKVYGNIAAETAPARARLLEMAGANPAVLQPYQMRAQQDLVDQIRRGLAVSGTRGASGSVAAGFDALARDRERMIEANRREAVMANNRLAGISFDAQGKTAGYTNELGQGNAAYKDSTGNMLSDTIGQVFGAAAGAQKPALANLAPAYRMYGAG